MINSKRLRIILQAALVLGFLLFVVVAVQGFSMLSKKSDQLIALKLKHKTVEAQLSNLAVAKKEVETYSYFKDVAKTVIPNDKDQAQTVSDITRLASEVGINIQSIAFPTSNLGGASSSPSSPSQSSPSSTSTPAPTNAQSASPKTALSQATLVEGIPGLYALQLTITSETGPQVPENRKVTYPKLLEFLAKLENNRRTAQITQISLQPEGDETNVTPYIDFTLIINIFMKP